VDKMNNLREIYQALLDGEAIAHVYWEEPERYVHLYNNKLVDNKGNVSSAYFHIPKEWHIWKETKKKVRFYFGSSIEDRLAPCFYKESLIKQKAKVDDDNHIYIEVDE